MKFMLGDRVVRRGYGDGKIIAVDDDDTVLTYRIRYDSGFEHWETGRGLALVYRHPEDETDYYMAITGAV